MKRAGEPSGEKVTMIPRLQLRPSSRRLSGIENKFVDANSNVDVHININANEHPGGADADDSASVFASRSDISEMSFSNSKNGGLSFKKDAQLSKEVDNPRVSPWQPRALTSTCDQSVQSPVPNYYGSQHKYLMLNYSSSSSTPLENDTDTSYDSMSYYSDFALTPPANGSRPPLLISAKRYGSEVRRQHNKKRRRRRRPTSTRSDSQNRSSALGGSVERGDSASGAQIDNGALCLWKGDPSGGAEEKNLPLLASSDEEEERSDRIEKIVRAEHSNQAFIAQGNGKLPPQHSSFSANRAPPPKGCLSNPRPKRPRGHANRYKTPSKSLENLVGLSELNFTHKSRRVQFGIPSAVEYEIDRPAGHLTPMSQEVTRKRYSMDPKKSSREEEKITQETKENNTILSEWENRFTDDRPKRNGSSSKRKRRNRRSSSIFSPASRMSLDYDDTHQSNSDVKKKSETKQPQISIGSRPSDSPSDMVATNLASLSMSSPNTFLEGSNTSTTPKPTLTPSTRREDEQRTWDFVADLGTINSKGAMELSSHSFNPGTIESARGGVTCEMSSTNRLMIKEENDSPQQHPDLDRINSLGAAFDNDSPNRGEKLPNDSSTGSSSLSCCIRVSRQSRDEEFSNIISKTLLESPWLDQEWDFATVLENLSLLMRRKDGGIQRYFTLIDPCVHEALSCAHDLIERMERAVVSQSKLRRQLSITNDLSLTKKAILTEWTEIEIRFLKELTSMLECGGVEIEKMKVLVATMNKCSFVNDRTLNLSPLNKQIEKEISEIEDMISRERISLDMLDACVAPQACILCQATAQVGIYGFCFEEFQDDHILKLNFIHSIFGAKTNVIIDLNSHPGVVIEPNCALLNRDKSCIIDFHQGYLAMLASGEISLRVNSSALQDSLLKLGQYLGKLDRCARAFKLINDERKAIITFDFPTVLLEIPAKGTIVCMALDPETFVTKTISVSTNEGKGFENTKPEGFSPVDCSNMGSLHDIICRYT